jgi:hypothetical protein
MMNAEVMEIMLVLIMMKYDAYVIHLFEHLHMPDIEKIMLTVLFVTISYHLVAYHTM